jgi:hypothetical protein
MLDAALAYQARGWHVLPLKPKSKDPHHDLITRGHLSSSDENKVAMAWFLRKPDANIGIAARWSGLVILDIDKRNGGEFTKLFNPTYTVRTPDGFHLYYKHDPVVQGYKSRLTGVDVKFNGYVAASPSIHPSGKKYQVIHDVEPQYMSAELLEEVIK